MVDALVSRADYLDRIQQACARFGEALEIRFFDHFDDGFDANVLDHLPGIRRLSIDGLFEIRNADAVGRLPRLASLRFGALRHGDASILAAMRADRLTHLTLAEAGTPVVDLTPLASSRSLRSLRMLTRGRNMDAIGSIASLSELAIQLSSKVPLDFIDRLQGLETLKLVLGNCASIAPIGALPGLRDLSIREVRNLEELGPIERFPRLRRLQISDQPKIADLHVGPRNLALEHLYLYSVPRLQAVHGLSMLPVIRSLFAYDSRLDPDWTGLPPTLTHFQLMSRLIRGRAAHEAQVREHGLIPAVHPDATFFYK